MKYELIVLAKKEKTLKNILDWLVEAGRNYRLEINVGE